MECYIEKLQKENKKLKDKMREFGNRFYCVGHPLNDNVLNFNKKQRLYLAKFAAEIRCWYEDNFEEVK
jgi:hypothetical protein